MSDETIVDIMRDLITSLEKKDLEKALSFFTEDATWVKPKGTFKGKEERRRLPNLATGLSCREISPFPSIS